MEGCAKVLRITIERRDTGSVYCYEQEAEKEIL